MTIILMVAIIIGYKVPNLKLVGPNQLHPILSIDFMVDYIRVTMMKERISS